MTIEHDHAVFKVEGRDEKGKLFQAEVVAGEVRAGAVPPEAGKGFEHRSRRAIMNTAHEAGASVRSIKRVD